MIVRVVAHLVTTFQLMALAKGNCTSSVSSCCKIQQINDTFRYQVTPDSINGTEIFKVKELKEETLLPINSTIVYGCNENQTFAPSVRLVSATCETGAWINRINQTCRPSTCARDYFQLNYYNLMTISIAEQNDSVIQVGAFSEFLNLSEFQTNTAVELNCSDDAIPSNNNSVIGICKRDGQWHIDNNFTCNPILCSATPPVVQNSKNETVDYAQRRINGTFTYKCNTGMKFENSAVTNVTCQKLNSTQGTWRMIHGDVKCIKEERMNISKRNCTKQPKQPDNTDIEGVVIVIDSDTLEANLYNNYTSYTQNSTIHYVCKHNYVNNSTNSTPFSMCNSNATWIESNLVCQLNGTETLSITSSTVNQHISKAESTSVTAESKTSIPPTTKNEPTSIISSTTESTTVIPTLAATTTTTTESTKAEKTSAPTTTTKTDSTSTKSSTTESTSVIPTSAHSTAKTTESTMTETTSTPTTTTKTESTSTNSPTTESTSVIPTSAPTTATTVESTTAIPTEASSFTTATIESTTAESTTASNIPQETSESKSASKKTENDHQGSTLHATSELSSTSVDGNNNTIENSIASSSSYTTIQSTASSTKNKAIDGTPNDRKERAQTTKSSTNVRDSSSSKESTFSGKGDITENPFTTKTTMIESKQTAYSSEYTYVTEIIPKSPPVKSK